MAATKLKTAQSAPTSIMDAEKRSTTNIAYTGPSKLTPKELRGALDLYTGVKL